MQVNLNYSRPTFFLGLLGSSTMYNRTSSIAKPWAETSYNVNASMFAVCGWDTKLASGGSMSILQGTAPGASPLARESRCRGADLHRPQSSRLDMRYGLERLQGSDRSGNERGPSCKRCGNSGTVADPRGARSVVRMAAQQESTPITASCCCRSQRAGRRQIP